MSDKPNKILVLFAHPSPERSEVNLPLFQAAQTIENVTTVDLYSEYPNFRINIEKEQRRLVEHDILIFLFPLYWYSTPALLKEWQELVLEYGFAYGVEAEALRGKWFMCAVSAGGSERAYQTDGYNHFTIREILIPLEQMAGNTGMNYLSPFAIFSARTAAEDHKIAHYIDDWKKLLIALRDHRLDLPNASGVAKINDYLDELILREDA
jgi:glutathione-regulated potassium-efflux system ancillary protein KefG